MKFEQEDIDIIINSLIERLKPPLRQRGDQIEDCFLDKESAAVLLCCKPRWFDDAEKKGIPKYLLGGQVRFKKSELLKWAGKQKVPLLEDY